MSRHRLSIRAATTLAMIFIGSLFVLLSWTAGTFFRDAALESQIKSLSRIIEVASNQVLRTIEKHALNLNMALNEGGQLSGAFEQFQRDGDQAPLLRALDDPLVNGFSDAADIDLVKLRVYDLKLNFLLESRVGMEGLPLACRISCILRHSSAAALIDSRPSAGYGSPNKALSIPCYCHWVG